MHRFVAESFSWVLVIIHFVIILSFVLAIVGTFTGQLSSDEFSELVMWLPLGFAVYVLFSGMASVFICIWRDLDSLAREGSGRDGVVEMSSRFEARLKRIEGKVDDLSARPSPNEKPFSHGEFQ